MLKKLFFLVCEVAAIIDKDGILHDHNIARCMHGASPLTWSDSLASHAQSWADTIKGDMRHGGMAFDGKHVGQNIAMGADSAAMEHEDRKSVKSWMSEESSYRGTYSSESGHYSQVVWKGSRQVGCGMWSGMSNGWHTQMVVCDYYPAGNLMGAFSQNVEGGVKTKKQCEAELLRVNGGTCLCCGSHKTCRTTRVECHGKGLKVYGFQSGGSNWACCGSGGKCTRKGTKCPGSYVPYWVPCPGATNLAYNTTFEQAESDEEMMDVAL